MGGFPVADSRGLQYVGPTLVVRGTRSHYVSNEALPSFGHFFPNYAVEDITGGHWVISENPQAFRKGTSTSFET